MLLPARTAVLNYLYGVKSADIKEIMEALKPQYLSTAVSANLQKHVTWTM